MLLVIYAKILPIIIPITTNSNKIKNEIKWIPKIKIQNGLEETFKWYLDNKEYFKTIKKNYITKRLGNG